MRHEPLTSGELNVRSVRAAVRWVLRKVRMTCWVKALIDVLRGTRENTRRVGVLEVNVTLGASESMWAVRLKQCAIG